MEHLSLKESGVFLTIDRNLLSDEGSIGLARVCVKVNVGATRDGVFGAACDADIKYLAVRRAV